MPLRYFLRKGFFMFNYYIRLNYKEKIHKTAEFRVINIYDNRFPYVELRNPFEINSQSADLTIYYTNLLNDEEYHWTTIKSQYYDTYNFLNSLRDRRANICNY